MAFVEPITIKEAIDQIHKKVYLLPAIQREFVWDTYQIERLFDSLMRDYPINSFLFWTVDKENTKNYQFYEFLREYHERDNRHNPKANLNGTGDIIAILDGQQRLTSLYLGLKGTYSYKLARKRWENNESFPKRKLYLNLLLPSKNEEFEYDFRFLTEDEGQERDENTFWFSVGEILNLFELHQINEYLIENGLLSKGDTNSKFANKTLFKLWKAVHETKSINFFLEKDESLDKVLNIFIRVNSGGTQLSYSDLLLSIASAQWKELDAREEITSFVDEINSIGDGFSIDKDFILKNCLVLGNFSEIAFKVDNFNQENMLAIEKNWDNITKSIKLSFILLKGFGYNRDTLTSNNAVIPISYFINKIGNPDNFTESDKYKNERAEILKWLVIVLLKRVFSGQPDNVLRPIRETIRTSKNGFSFTEIADKLKGTSKSLSFDEDDLHNLLFYQYGQSYTYSILALLYPTLDFRNKFHQDHIFPKKQFTRKKLLKAGIPDDEIVFYLENYNCIANLQLLEGIPNQEKSGTDFKEWLDKKFPDKEDRKIYMKKNYVPDIDLSLTNFKMFIEQREKMILSKFKEIIS